MTVNLNQCCRTVTFLIIVKFCWRKAMVHPYKKNILKTHLIQIVIILILLTVRYVISLNSAQNTRFLHQSLFHSFYFINAVSHIHHVWLYSLATRRRGDIEENPCPKPNSCDYLSVCYWNLKSISTHKFIKLSLPRAYISINKTDIICLSKTYLDSSISSDNDNLELPG